MRWRDAAVPPFVGFRAGDCKNLPGSVREPLESKLKRLSQPVPVHELASWNARRQHSLALLRSETRLNNAPVHAQCGTVRRGGERAAHIGHQTRDFIRMDEPLEQR